PVRPCRQQQNCQSRLNGSMRRLHAIRPPDGTIQLKRNEDLSTRAMPELPEVETTRRGIEPLVTGRALERLVVREPRLRWPVPPGMAEHLAGRRVLACGRRGKYLLLHFEHGTQLVHLGMSGSLRRVDPGEPVRRHHHVEWRFGEAVLRLPDPRRFGAVLWHASDAGP